MASDQIDIELAPIRDSVFDNQSDPASRTDTVPVSSQSTNSNTICDEQLSLDEMTKKNSKYIGYRGYCNFIFHINDNLIIRRFGALNVRVLLALQDKVAVIEEKLQELDDEYSSPDADYMHNGKMRGDKKNRRKLIRKAQTSLKQYCRLNALTLSRVQGLRSMIQIHLRNSSPSLQDIPSQMIMICKISLIGWEITRTAFMTRSRSISAKKGNTSSFHSSPK